MWLLRFVLLVIFLLVPFSSPVMAVGENYTDIRSDYQRLIKSSQLQQQRHNWENLILRFDTFSKKNPQQLEVEKALFLQARTWDGLSRVSGRSVDARQAVSKYLEMANRYPQSSLADDALFYAGQVSEIRLDDQIAAYQYYQRLLNRLPHGDMAVKAAKNLAQLPAPVVAPETTRNNAGAAPAGSSNSIAPRLDKIRFWSGPEYTRVVLDLSSQVKTEPHLLKGERPRIYFDLLNTELAPSQKTEVNIQNGLVQRVRVNRFDEQRVRVVLDLEKDSEFKFVTLDSPYRIVLDVKGQPESSAIVVTPEISNSSVDADDSIASILDQVPNQTPALHVPQHSKDEGIRLIVVDAGHGGRDPGAIGTKKILEKNVTLGVAKALAAQLRKELGVKVLMTRNSDKYIKLSDRTAYANKVDADLFISLHANASPNGRAYGIESYFLNLSKNKQAAEVAARENETSLEEVSNLEAILFDLMANAKINESSRLAAEVQQALISGLRSHYPKIKDLGVRQGPFHVLLGATMPSVLIEMAFLSNRREEKRLSNRKYQQRVAAAIVKGIKRYTATVEQVAKR